MSRKHLRITLGACLLALPVFGQGEAVLQRYFEGKEVTVKMDMPGDVSGIDIHPEREQPVDYRRVGDGLRRYGTALRKGDRAMITKVLLKGKLVEFQLAGGGYGTFADRMNEQSTPSTSVSKSRRESNLEAERKTTADAARIRKIDEELDDLRKSRQREETRLRAEAAQVEAMKKNTESDVRLRSGSRFNVRYQQAVPLEVQSPAGLMAALAAYVEFPAESFQSGSSAPAALRPGRIEEFGPKPASAVALRKGMSEKEVNAMLGSPHTRNVKEAAGMEIVECTYRLADADVSAQFVSGVMTKYTISGR